MKLRYFLLVNVVFISNAFAGNIIYPAKGQSEKQQSADEGACYVWAKEKSGFDPLSASTANETPDKSNLRTRISKGTAFKGAIRRARESQGSAPKRNNEGASSRVEFDKANLACLEGRGYTVK